jgi:hypothetical protein
MPYDDQPPFDDFRHDDTYDRDDELPAIRSALGRVRLPAIFLIIVGLLNIPGSLFWALTGANAIWNAEANEEISKQMNLPKTDPGQMKMGGYFYFGLCVVSFIAAAITIFGGVRMLKLKSYPLAVIASAFAVIPCVSPMGCCGLGEATGIWAFVVLMNADVRSSFR